MKEKNSKTLIILGIIVGIILVSLLTFIFYNHYKKDSIKIFETTINNLYTKLDSSLEKAQNSKEKDNNLLESTMKISANFKINSNIDDFMKYNNQEYNLTTYLNMKDNKSYLELNAKNKEEYIINCILYYLNGNSYFKSDELIDKVLLLSEADNNTPLGDDSEETTINYEEVRLILRKLKEIMINSLDEKYFKIINQKIIVNNKEYKTEKHIYTLDDKNIERTLKFIINSILKDKKLLTSLSNVTSLEEDMLIDLLNSYLDKINQNDLEFEKQSISLYLYKGNVISVEIEELNLVIKYDSIDDYFNLSITSSETEIKIDKSEEDIKFFMKENGVEIFKGNIISKEDYFKINITMSEEGIPITLYFEINHIDKDTTTNSFDISLGINMNVLGNKFNVSLDGNYKTETVDEMPELDISNAITSFDITEEEKENIIIKLNDILNKLGFNQTNEGTI